jgi:hypothetical protein
MTVNVARRNRRRTFEPVPEANPVTESIAIGEINQTVFDCPSCARPLVLGTRRCPSCGTRLILGVATSKAALLGGLGLAIGILAGGTIGYTAGVGRAGAAPVAAGIVLPIGAPGLAGGGGKTPNGVRPTATPAPSASETGSTGPVPALSRSALLQAVGVNSRLGADAVALQASLKARVFDASVVAQTLRTISGDSVFGLQLAGRMGDWPSTATLGLDLTSFYDSVHQTAIDGLVASVRDDAAYRSTAGTMLKVLAGLSAVDTETQSVAAQIGLDIAPSSAP